MEVKVGELVSACLFELWCSKRTLGACMDLLCRVGRCRIGFAPLRDAISRSFEGCFVRSGMWNETSQSRIVFCIEQDGPT